MAKKSTRSQERCPSHPGKLLREVVVPALNKPKTEIAKALGISRSSLYELLNEEQSVTPEMAVRMSIVFNGTPQSWMNMQTAHDLWHAQRKIDEATLQPLHECA